jgi:DNA-binding MarR family transcriptional regulator
MTTDAAVDWPGPKALTGAEAECDRIGTEVIRLTRLFERVQARYAAHHADGLERAAFMLLANLVKRGPQRLSALAEVVHSDVSTVSRQANQLVRLEMVARRPDPSDGRASLLAATDLGHETFEAKRARRNQSFAEVLADWSDADRHALCELVARFNDDFEHHHLKGSR